MGRLLSSGGAEPDQSRRIRVLLVDDSAATLAALSQVLVQLFPIQIVGQAENGQDALALAEQLDPDLCIADFQMPGLDGLQLVRLLREKHPDVRSIVISVHDRPALYAASLEAGAAAFITKQNLADQLPAHLNRLFPGTARQGLVDTQVKRLATPTSGIATPEANT
jgi:DNA-binding NarL/FixJ family response regulator